LSSGINWRNNQKEARKTIDGPANAAFNSAQEFSRHDLLLRFHNLPNVPCGAICSVRARQGLTTRCGSLMENAKMDLYFMCPAVEKFWTWSTHRASRRRNLKRWRRLPDVLQGEEKADTYEAGKVYMSLPFGY